MAKTNLTPPPRSSARMSSQDKGQDRVNANGCSSSPSNCSTGILMTWRPDIPRVCRRGPRRARGSDPWTRSPSIRQDECRSLSRSATACPMHARSDSHPRYLHWLLKDELPCTVTCGRPVRRGLADDLLSGRSQPNAHRSSLADMFNLGQRTAVAGAFKLAGYEGNLVVAPITSGDERIFLWEPEAFNALRDRDVLEQVLTQLLRLKVWVAQRTEQWGKPIPFE